MECTPPLKPRHFPSLPGTEIKEPIAELGGHDIVKDGIQSRVCVEHDPAKVQKVVVQFHVGKGIMIREKYVQSKDTEREETKEESEYDGAQHEYNLSASPVICSSVSPAQAATVRR